MLVQQRLVTPCLEGEVLTSSTVQTVPTVVNGLPRQSRRDQERMRNQCLGFIQHQHFRNRDFAVAKEVIGNLLGAKLMEGQLCDLEAHHLDSH